MMSSFRRRLSMQCISSPIETLIYYGNKTGVGGYIELDYDYLFVCTLGNGDIVLGNCNNNMYGNSSTRYYVYFPVSSSYKYYKWNTTTSTWNLKQIGDNISVQEKVTLGNSNVLNYYNFIALGFIEPSNYNQEDWEV